MLKHSNVLRKEAVVNVMASNEPMTGHSPIECSEKVRPMLRNMSAVH